MKMKIKKALVWNAGNSAVITIPSDYITNKHIEVGKKYDLILEVSEE